MVNLGAVNGVYNGSRDLLGPGPAAEVGRVKALVRGDTLDRLHQSHRPADTPRCSSIMLEDQKVAS